MPNKKPLHNFKNLTDNINLLLNHSMITCCRLKDYELKNLNSKSIYLDAETLSN